MPTIPDIGQSLQQNNNPMYYGVSQNPVFQVKIKSLDTNLGQRQEMPTDKISGTSKDFHSGDIVQGKKFNSDSVHTGFIISITDSYILIKDTETSDLIKLDKTSCSLVKIQPDRGTGKDLIFIVENFITFEEFECL